jgi:hypothetical protein
MKSNGVVLLEPSFCSQFLALAAIVELERDGTKWWRIAIYLAGIIPTIAGTGLMLLAFGLIVITLRRSALWALGMLLGTIAVTVIVAVTPAGKLFADRASESREAGSSLSLRFIEPYQRAFDDLGATEHGPFVGRGPGHVERVAEEYEERTDNSLAFPAVPKLISEYGLVAAVAFVWFTLLAFWSRAPSAAIAAAVLFFHLTLSGSLLQPPTVYICLLISSIFAAAVPFRPIARAPLGAPAVPASR